MPMVGSSGQWSSNQNQIVNHPELTKVLDRVSVMALTGLGEEILRGAIPNIEGPFPSSQLGW